MVPLVVDIGTDVEIIAYAHAFIDNNSHLPWLIFFKRQFPVQAIC